MNKLSDKEINGLEMLKEFIDEYQKAEYPSVDDDILVKFCTAARLLHINHIILPEDDSSCPECGFVSGKIGKAGISLHTGFGMNVLCIYCSFENEQEMMDKHDMANCTHDKCNGDHNGDCWSTRDCRHLYDGFEKMYNKIVKELFENDI